MKLSNFLGAVLMASMSAVQAAVERDAKGVPTAFRILKTGKTIFDDLTQGKAVEADITVEDISEFHASYVRGGRKLPLDCEHFLGHLATQLGKSEAELVEENKLLGEMACAGLVSLEARNNGTELWAKVEKLADRARDLLAASGDKLYGYFSPFLRGLKDGPMVVTSVALTNTPATRHLDILAASALPADQLKTLGAALGLDEAACSGKSAGDLLPIAVAKVTGLSKALADLTTKANADAAALTALRTAQDAATKKALLDQAEAEGKLTPALRKDWAEGQDLMALSAWAKHAPKVVPVVGQTDTTKITQTKVPSAEVLEVAGAMGIDPAKLV